MLEINIKINCFKRKLALFMLVFQSNVKLALMRFITKIKLGTYIYSSKRELRITQKVTNLYIKLEKA